MSCATCSTGASSPTNAMPRSRPSPPRVASPRTRNTAAATVTPRKLRNACVEFISGTMSAATATVAAEVVPASQPGFIHRRNFGYNVLELDVESRI
eukprot:3999558-Pyramimonas_sp.AAC.1